MKSSFSILLGLMLVLPLSAHAEGNEEKIQTFASCTEAKEVLSSYFLKASGIQDFSLVSDMGMVREETLGNGIKESLEAPSATADAAPPSSKNIQKGGDYSQTNIQVKGVDEADKVKQDEKYIYFYSREKQAILRVEKGNTLKIKETIPYPDNYGEPLIYLSSGKLVVIATKYDGNFRNNYYWYGGQNKSVAIVYTLSETDPASIERIFEVDGNYRESRVVDGYLYMISDAAFQMPIAYYRGGKFMQQEFNENFQTNLIIPQKFELRKVSSMKQANYRKEGKLQPYRQSRGLTQSCAGISYVLPDLSLMERYPNGNYSLSLKVISTIDIARLSKPTTTKLFFGDINEIHMSPKSLYIAASVYQNPINNCPPNARCIMPAMGGGSSTKIMKFGISQGKVTYQTAKSVPGRPLSQYSMDENGDNFRIITASEDWNSAKPRSTGVYVLDKDLGIQGKLENIAPGENFQSSRFIGNRLYLVTFEQIDPLFVIDLSNKDPKVLGELKIPGYSTYLHPYDENRLIGIGYATEESKWGGTMNAGIKVDLYNVANVSKPTQEQSMTLGSVGSYSEALNNPRVFVWDSENNLLYLPATLYAKSLDLNNPYQASDGFNGISVIKITPSGISESGRISHMNLENTQELEAERTKECREYSVKIEPVCRKLIGGGTYCSSPYQYIPNYCYVDSPIGEFRVTKIQNNWDHQIERVLYSGEFVYALSNGKLSQHIRGGDYKWVDSISLK